MPNWVMPDWVMPKVFFNRALEESESLPAEPWPIQDIIYVGVVGTVMLAAMLEWFLWLLAFIYCLIKVYRKADEECRRSTRIMAVVNLIFFTAMRCIFLPIMVVTLPLPSQIVAYFPRSLVVVLQWFAFYTFAGLLTIPWLLCIYQIVTHDVGGRRRARWILDAQAAPKVVIVMPCYNEEVDILLRTVESIADCDYPPACLHIFVSFDGDRENDLYLSTIEKLGVPLTPVSYPQSIDLVYRQCRITVSRFPHGGKRSCQKHTFKLIDRVYQTYLRRHDDLFILFIDSDCILDKYCIQSFLYEMELKPGSKRTALAQTGVITSTTTKNSLITLLQDMEYIHGQLFERTVESGCGAVTCLPGALTIFRFSAFRKVSKWYFANKAEQCEDLFDYGKMHLGEDRWLTHLFMISSSHRGQIQMNTGAFCKTEAVQTFRSLLKQRRRWFLGFITNETVMLTDIRLWRKFPLLMVMRLAQGTIRTTALLFFIMVISIMTTSQKISNLPAGFIAVSLGLNWALMFYFGIKLRRFKILLYPLMFIVNPFFNWLYLVYGIFTAGQRTWGGPRADASKADEGATVNDAIEQAKAKGDELDVVLETFKPAAEARRQRPIEATPLMPPIRLVGRFTASKLLPGRWLLQADGSGFVEQSRPHRRLQRRRHASRSSWSTSESSRSRSPCRPRRLESIIGSTERAQYHDQLNAQKPAGGVGYTTRLTSSNVQAAEQTAIAQHALNTSQSAQPHYVMPSRPIDSHHGPDIIPVRRHLGPDAAGSERLISNHSHRRKSPATTPLRELSRRLGGSPLARKSFTRLAADQKTIPDNESRAICQPVPEEARGGRSRRPSISVDRRGRRGLSNSSQRVHDCSD